MKFHLTKRLFYKIIVAASSLNLVVLFITGAPARVLERVMADQLTKEQSQVLAPSSKAIELVYTNVVHLGDYFLMLLSGLVVMIAALTIVTRAIIAARRRHKDKRRLSVLSAAPGP